MLEGCFLLVAVSWGMEEFSGRNPMTPADVAVTCLAPVCYGNPKLKKNNIKLRPAY